MSWFWRWHGGCGLSPTYECLRDYIAKRMRMSHIYQPLMLMELLGHGFARQQPAQPPRKT